MAGETNKKTVWSQQTKEKSDMLSQMKGFLQKFKKTSGTKKQTTKVFNLTRKDAIVSVMIALGVLTWAGLYWTKVRNDYVELNNKSDSLKNLSTYDVKYNESLLNPYSEWNWINSISEIIWTHENIVNETKDYETFEKQQRSYYEILLQNIYLPSLNVWKDPYTKNFDMSILWQKYLEMDKFQDLFLIQYWSDFFKYVWNDADYNIIESISIWDKVILPDNPDYFYTPISISFSSPNKRSFLLLVNKLSTTSNQSNIALVNEIFFYLLNAIKEDKSDLINQLMEKYWETFSSSSDRDLPSNFSDLTPEQESQYMDRIIWYHLYHWINNDWVIDEKDQLIDDKIIVKAIRQGTLCNDSDSDQKCFYNFRDKYRNLPYLAYNIGLEKQSNRTEWLLSFLQWLPPIIAISDFWFEKYSNSSFLNNEWEQYEWNVRFNAYWRSITDAELKEAALSLWKLCFWKDSEESISPEIWLSRVNEVIGSYWWKREYSNVSSLWELQWLFTDLERTYSWMTNYDKMIKLFEIWRMMNDANLCIQ